MTPEPESFTLWTTGTTPGTATQPTAANSGAGVLRAAPTTVVNGNVTVPTGTVYADRIINGFVDIQGTGVLENCIVRGPATAGAGGQRPLVQTTAATAGTFRNVRFCTLDPQTPSSYLAGIGHKNYHAYRNRIENVTDYFSIFSQTADGLANVVIEGNYAPQQIQWQPDPANANRSHTHNDAIQWQGNLGGASDSVIRGNALYARLNPSIGQPSTVAEFGPRTHNNGLTQTPNTQTKCGGTIDRNWLYGGVQLVNLSGTTGAFTVTNNILEKPGTHAQAPTRALVVGNFTDGVTVTNNVYPDGTAVPRATS